MTHDTLSPIAKTTGKETSQPNSKLSRRAAAGGVYNRIASWLFFPTCALGLWYLWEAFLGKYPKPNELWLSGETITKLAHKAIESGTWWPVQWGLENVVIPEAAFFAILVFALQVTIGLALILGVGVRLSLVTGTLMMTGITMWGFSQTPPLLLALGLLLLAAPTECFILDRALLRKSDGIRNKRLRGAVRWLVTLGLEPLFEKYGMAMSRVCGVLAIFLVLGGLNMPTGKMVLASFELGVIAALVAASLHFGARRQSKQVGSVNGNSEAAPGSLPPALNIASRAMQFYLGYKFLWTAIASTTVKITSMPGFAAPSQLLEVVIDPVIVSHWTPIAWLVGALFSSEAAMTGLSIVTGIVQLTIGFMLMLDWPKSSKVKWAALGLLAVYLGAGLTRYVPYLVTIVITLLALRRAGGGGRLEKPRRLYLCGAALVALLSLALAAWHGVTPNPFTTNVGFAVFASIGIIATALTAALALARR